MSSAEINSDIGVIQYLGNPRLDRELPCQPRHTRARVELLEDSIECLQWLALENPARSSVATLLCVLLFYNCSVTKLPSMLRIYGG